MFNICPICASNQGHLRHFCGYVAKYAVDKLDLMCPNDPRVQLLKQVAAGPCNCINMPPLYSSRRVDNRAVVQIIDMV